MNTLLATIYLGILLTILGLVFYFLISQISNKRKLEEDLRTLKNKIESGSATPNDYYSLGSIYLSKKLFDQAILQFSKALKNWDKNDLVGYSSLYNAIGFTYFESEQIDMSIYYYQEAVNLNPTYIIALNNLAHSYEKKRMFQKASEIYKKVLQYDKNNPVAEEKLEYTSRKIRNSG